MRGSFIGYGGEISVAQSDRRTTNLRWARTPSVPLADLTLMVRLDEPLSSGERTELLRAGLLGGL